MKTLFWIALAGALASAGLAGCSRNDPAPSGQAPVNASASPSPSAN